MERRDALRVRPDELDSLDNALCGVDGWSRRGDAWNLLAGQALSLLPGGCQAAYSQVQFLGIVESRNVAISICAEGERCESTNLR
jgi:hypothetical protein